MPRINISNTAQFLSLKKLQVCLLIVGFTFLSVIAINAIFIMKNLDDLTIYWINQRRSYFPKTIANFLSNKPLTALDLSLGQIFSLFPREIKLPHK